MKLYICQPPIGIIHLADYSYTIHAVPWQNGWDSRIEIIIIYNTLIVWFFKAG